VEDVGVVFSVQQVKYEFLAYIRGVGGAFGDWYVGAAVEPTSILFQAHRVRPDSDPWIYKPLLTYRATRTVVRYFTEVLHTDGMQWAEISEGSDFAFAFRKSCWTSPNPVEGNPVISLQSGNARAAR
jgi:hypothetical protein